MTDRVSAIARSVEALLRRHPVMGGDRSGGLAGPDVLVGLVGRGIQLSRSPAMHEREAARLGLCCAYVLVDFDALNLDDADLGMALDAIASLGFHGVNVTYPFKQSIIPLLDEVAPDAAVIGAVNTVVFGARCVGHNTDSWGFAESFRTDMADVRRDRVVLFGAGGAGSAVGQALIGLGARQLTVIDRDPARAQALAGRLAEGNDAVLDTTEDIATAVTAADGVVNTTPMGMAKYPGTPFPASLLRATQWVADVVYFPQETELLRAARAIGCRTLPGIGMAIGQAARAFELFTGRAADMAAMAHHFEAAA